MEPFVQPQSLWWFHMLRTSTEVTHELYEGLTELVWVHAGSLALWLCDRESDFVTLSHLFIWWRNEISSRLCPPRSLHDIRSPLEKNEACVRTPCATDVQRALLLLILHPSLPPSILLPCSLQISKSAPSEVLFLSSPYLPRRRRHSAATLLIYEKRHITERNDLSFWLWELSEIS